MAPVLLCWHCACYCDVGGSTRIDFIGNNAYIAYIAYMAYMAYIAYTTNIANITNDSIGLFECRTE